MKKLCNKGLSVAYKCFALVYNCYRPQVPSSKFQDPKTPHMAWLSMLPIPSLKKVKITKTKKINKENRPKTVSPTRKSPAATFPMLPFAKEIHWLCTSIAIKAKRKKSCFSQSQKALLAEKPPELFSRTFSFNWFCLLCYLLSCYVALFNRECSGETVPVSKEISPKGKRGLRTLLDQQENSFPPNVTITKPFSGPKAIGEDKELIQKSKGRRKNMPRAKKEQKEKLYFEEK